MNNIFVWRFLSHNSIVFAYVRAYMKKFNFIEQQTNWHVIDILNFSANLNYNNNRCGWLLAAADQFVAWTVT